MPLTSDTIDSIETELFALIRAAGEEMPLSQFRFQGETGDAALRVLLPYQRLPVDLRRLRIQVRLHYRQTERVVSVVDLRQPPEWLRPERRVFKRGARVRGFVPGLTLGDVRAGR